MLMHSLDDHEFYWSERFTFPNCAPGPKKGTTCTTTRQTGLSGFNIFFSLMVIGILKDRAFDATFVWLGLNWLQQC